MQWLRRCGRGADVDGVEVVREVDLVKHVVDGQARVQFPQGDAQAVGDAGQRGAVRKAADASGRGGRGALAGRLLRDSLGPVGRPG